MGRILSLLLPYGLVILLLAGAALLFGADTGPTRWFFAGALLTLCGLGLMLSRAPVPVWALVPLGLIGASALFDIVSGRFVLAQPAYGALMAALAVLLTGRAGALKPSRAEWLWQGLLLLFCLIGLWALADFMVNPDTIHGQPRPYHAHRLSAAFLSANTAATFFGMGAILAFAGVLQAFGRIESTKLPVLLEGLYRHAALSMATLIVCLLCLFLTASRAGLAFCALVLMVYLIWELVVARRAAQARLVGPALVAVSALVAVFGLFFVLSGDMAEARYAQIDGDAGTRALMFRTYLGAMEGHWLTGHGFGSFQTVNNAVMTADNAAVFQELGAVHNVVIQWLLQVGLAGTLAMIGVMGAVGAALWRGLGRAIPGRTRLRAVIAVAAFVGLHSMVDYAVEIPGFMWLFAFILGIGLGLAGTGARRRSE